MTEFSEVIFVWYGFTCGGHKVENQNNLIYLWNLLS